MGMGPPTGMKRSLARTDAETPTSADKVIAGGTYRLSTPTTPERHPDADQS